MELRRFIEGKVTEKCLTKFLMLGLIIEER